MAANFSFSEANKQSVQTIIKKYPEKFRFSAIMPVLTLAQKQNNGYLTTEIISYVAQYLNVTDMAVNEVANFYSMYNLQRVGKYNIQICNSVVCYSKGSEDLIRYCKSITKTEMHDISEDGLFSVKKVECLGACVNALALKVNDVFYEDLTEDSLSNLINYLKEEKPLSGDSNVRKSTEFHDNEVTYTKEIPNINNVEG